jgi:hypothetical protein
MHKIVHSTFELDLTKYGLSFVEENYWFTDQFFTKYSFPFPIYLTAELIKTFGYFLDDNNEFVKTTFNVVYYFGNQKETAVFQIESQVGVRLEANLRYGFDELPNFNKKLSELPLEVIAKTSIPNIYNHAKTIIPQIWPAVNYNYPQIHTDDYDTEELTWAAFGKKINNYVSGDFPVNEETLDGYVNRNIIQPLPYLLHVLTQGFLDAGFTLKGDLTTNEMVKKILLYKKTDYFTIGSDILALVLRGNYTAVANEVEMIAFSNLMPEFTYQVTGQIAIHTDTSGTPSQGPRIVSETLLIYKGTVLGSVDNSVSDVAFLDIDATFTTNTDTTQKLEFISYAMADDVISNEILFDLNIKRVLNGVAEPVNIYKDVDLTRAVPDVTFGTLITELKKQLNIEVDPQGADIYLNFVEDKVNYNEAVDLSAKEVLKPSKRFNRLDSILLKYEAPSNETVKFAPIFQNNDGYLNNDSLVNDNTETIEIDILPLTQKSVDLIETAFNFDDGGESKIYMCLYEGLQNTLNLTINNAPLLIPNLHILHHRKWFSFRLSSINYRWIFKMYLEQLATINKKVFAYGRYHVVKSIEKTQISKDLFEVEIETETLI